jgi:ACS family tartrate transporter-like MFS transporter
MTDFSATVPRKVLVRVLAPFLLLSFLNSLDRANVGFAALQMNQELGFSHETYGNGGSIFYLAYVLFQFPSMWLLRRIGGRRWLFCIVGFWGLSATAMAFIRDASWFYILRFTLGMAEAGFVPGVIYYASRWMPRRWRGSAFSFPILAVPVSMIFGGPLSGLLMSLPNPLGLSGWRWMILLEGLPSILLACIAPFYFNDKPEEAKWLKPDEKAWLDRELAEDSAKVRAGERTMDWSVLKNPLVWLSTLAWFCIMSGGYAMNHWLPLVIKQMSGLSDFQTAALTAAPWLGIGAGMALNAWHSDKTQERYLHVGCMALLGAAGIALAVFTGGSWIGLVLLMIGGFGLGGAQSTFFTIPTSFLDPGKAAVAITLINVFGTTSGIFVPKVIGAIRDRTGSYDPALYPLAVLLVIAATLVLVVRSMAARAAEPA